MEIRVAWCSACDREIRVVARPEIMEEGEVDLDRLDVSDLVCLEHGESCTGDMCPVFDVPTPVMRENLEKALAASGQRPDPGAEGGS